MNTQKIRITLGAFALALSCSPFASGATIQFVDSFSDSDSASGTGEGPFTTTLNGSLSVPLFDPAQGTLTGVTIVDTITVGKNAELVWTATNNGTVGGAIQLGYASNNPVISANIFIPFGQAVGTGLLGFYNLNPGASEDVTTGFVFSPLRNGAVDSLFVPDLVGVGTFDESVELVQNLVVADIGGIDPADISVNGSTELEMTRTITYEFDPIPEPSTLSFVILGLAGLVRRRR